MRLLVLAILTLAATPAAAQVSPFRSGYSFGVRPYYGIQAQQQQNLNYQYNQLRIQRQLFGPTIYNFNRAGRYTGYSRFQYGRLNHFSRSGRYTGYGRIR